MRKEVVILALSGIAVIGLVMTIVSFQEKSSPRHVGIDHCVPDVEILSDNGKYLCMTAEGDVYLVAVKQPWLTCQYPVDAGTTCPSGTVADPFNPGNFT